VSGHRPLPLHLPLPIPEEHRRHARPVGRQPRRFGDDRHGPLLGPPVAILDRLVSVGPDPGEVGLPRPREHRLDGRPQGRLVVKSQVLERFTHGLPTY
jgi:hypothetical protein